MTRFLTEETPGKVTALLGTALTSMFFLFAVTVTNASFQQVEKPFPDPFSPVKVVAVVDQTSGSYSKFLYANLINPGVEEYAYFGDSISYIADNAGPQIMQITGLQKLADARAAYLDRPQVAGAFIRAGQEASSGQGIVMTKLYSMFVVK